MICSLWLRQILQVFLHLSVNDYLPLLEAMFHFGLVQNVCPLENGPRKSIFFLSLSVSLPLNLSTSQFVLQLCRSCTCALGSFVFMRCQVQVLMHGVSIEPLSTDSTSTNNDVNKPQNNMFSVSLHHLQPQNQDHILGQNSINMNSSGWMN